MKEAGLAACNQSKGVFDGSHDSTKNDPYELHLRETYYQIGMKNL